MKVPSLDLTRQYETLRAEVRRAIDRVCDGQAFILGPEVAAFEQELAQFTGARFAIGMSSGTDALLAALMTIDVGPGDEVVTSPYSFFATAGVIVRLGARPVFVDIERDSFNLNAESAAECVTSATKAVIPVHLFGRCSDMEPLLRVTSLRERITIIEDAAQAIGSIDAKGRRAGSVGAMGCFSFFPSKNLGAFGDGGMVVTDSESLAPALRAVRVHGADVKYYHKTVGGNFRLDAIQAAVLRVKLGYLEGWNALRRTKAERYRELFAEAGLGEEIALPVDVPGHIYNQFVIRCASRDDMRAYLTERGIGTQVYYPVPLHLQDCFRDLGYGPGDFPEAERAAKESLALPMFPELTEEEQRQVVGEIRKFVERSC